MTSYIALIRKDAGSDYGVEFPDFPGCVTAGRTLDEAQAMAAEALALHADGMAEDGNALPSPTDLATVMADRRNRAAAAIVVDLPARAAPSIRINVTLPQDLVAEIDRRARNRSRFLAEAARSKLSGLK